MEGWDVYIDIFVVTKTLQEAKLLRKFQGEETKE